MLFENLIRRALSFGKYVCHKVPPPIKYHFLGRWLVPPRFEYISNKQKRLIYDDLHHRLKSGRGPSIWFLSYDSWFNTAFQRPQQMALALAEAGCSVIYYEPWKNNLNFMSKEGLQKRTFIGVQDIEPGLHLLRCPINMISEFIIRIKPDALYLMWPDQASLISPDMSSFVIYDIFDDHSIKSNADKAWHNTHKEWIEKADIIVTTADILLAQLSSQRPDTLLLPNGVQTKDWKFSTKELVPEDMDEARGYRAVIGYHGAISEWFNWEMWEYAAKIRPDWAFVLIGFPYLITLDSINKRISQYPNMYYLGPKSYKNLINYTIDFDVATIPFVLNQITHACSPVKLFEYMAADKPIVASPMQEILKYKSVYIADSPEKFVIQLEKALSMKDDPEYRSILRQEAEANTWNSRAKLLRQTLESVCLKQNNIPRRFMHTKNSN